MSTQRGPAGAGGERGLGGLRRAGGWPAGLPGRSLPPVALAPGSPALGPGNHLAHLLSYLPLGRAEDAAAQVTRASFAAGRRALGLGWAEVAEGSPLAPRRPSAW